MKRLLVRGACLGVAAMATSALQCVAQTPSSPDLVPRPKVVRWSEGRVSLAGGALLLEPDVRDDLHAVVDRVERVLGDRSAGGVAIRAEVVGDGCAWGSEICRALAREEAYWIRFSDDTVRVVAGGRAGLGHALTRLQQLAVWREDGAVPGGEILDWPDLAVRAVHFPLRPDETFNHWMVQRAREGLFNTIVVHLTGSVQYPSMGRGTSRQSLPMDRFEAFVREARANGLDVVPEVKLLTHQQALFGRLRPDLLFNRFTYDPRLPETYDVVFGILQDLIDAARPRAIHIGHDELAGSPAYRNPAFRLRRGEEMLPPELFLHDVETIHGWLADRGIETWMWGDVLLDPEEFPQMRAGRLHGTAGHASLRERLPEGIVICDWHYEPERDYPSARAFARAGHDVIGASWKTPSATRDFASFVASMGGRGRGMMATTWTLAREEDTVAIEDVLNVSSEAFWNAGGREHETPE